jgi:hypothetical protein
MGPGGLATPNRAGVCGRPPTNRPLLAVREDGGVYIVLVLLQEWGGAPSAHPVSCLFLGLVSLINSLTSGKTSLTSGKKSIPPWRPSGRCVYLSRGWTGQVVTSEQACVAAVFAASKVDGRHGAPGPVSGRGVTSGLGMGSGLRLRSRGQWFNTLTKPRTPGRCSGVCSG